MDDFTRFLKNAFEGIYYDSSAVDGMFMKVSMRFLLRLHSL